MEDISGKFLHNRTKSADSVPCFTQRAGDKNFWIETVKYANGFSALVAFVEIFWILSRVRDGLKFMDNPQFYADHLKSNSNEPPQAQSDKVRLEESHQHSRAPNDFSSAIQTLKENCLRDTKQLSDLKQPFRRPNHGEGHRPVSYTHLTLPTKLEV